MIYSSHMHKFVLYRKEFLILLSTHDDTYRLFQASITSFLYFIFICALRGPNLESNFNSAKV